MPRVASLDGISEKDKQIYKLIAKKCIDKEMNDRTLSIKVGIPLGTYRNKKKYPHLFSLDDIQKISTVLKFTDEEKVMCL